MSISAEKFNTKVHISKGKQSLFATIGYASTAMMLSSAPMQFIHVAFPELHCTPQPVLLQPWACCDNFGAFCWERGIPDWTPEDYNWLSTGWLRQYLYFLVPQGKIHPSGTALRKEWGKVTKAEAVPWRCSITLELHQEQDFLCWHSYTGTGGFGIIALTLPGV